MKKQDEIFMKLSNIIVSLARHMRISLNKRNRMRKYLSIAIDMIINKAVRGRKSRDTDPSITKYCITASRAKNNTKTLNKKIMFI